MMMLDAARLRSARGREFDDRVGDPQLAEGRAPGAERTGRTGSAPSRRGRRPVPLLPLAERDLPAAHHQGEQPQADVVEVERPAAQLRPLPLEVIGVIDREVAHQVAEDADREVDQEEGDDLNSGSASCMISMGGSFFNGWRMVRFLTTILPKSAERRKPPNADDEFGWLVLGVIVW